jgi:hypothetical protein
VNAGTDDDEASGSKAAKKGPKVYVSGPAALAVARAFSGARRKLEDPRCQELLTDFTDPEGRMLRENLGGDTPALYLDRLVIRDGEIPKGSGRCRHAAAGAFTVRGSGVVFLCGRNFVQQGPRLQENALIHEMLHGLGLGENPPSSQEISRQVEKRCGL